MVIAAADIAVIALALLAFLLAYTLAQIIHYVIEVPLSSISIVGIHPFSGLASLAADAASTVMGWAVAAEQPLADALSVTLNGATNIWGNVRGFADAAVTRIESTVRVDIPSAASYARDAAIGWAQGAVNELRGWAQGAINWAEQAAIQDATNARDAAIGWAQGAVNALQGWTQGAISELQGWTQGAISEAEQLAASSLSRAEELIYSDLQALNGRVAAEAQREAADVAGLAGDVRGLAGQLAGDVQSLSHEIDINKAAAAAAVGVVAAELTKWLKDCGDPLCNNLSGFGNDIAQLINAAEIGLLFAFLAEAYRSPEATAQAAAGPITDLIRGGEAILNAIL